MDSHHCGFLSYEVLRIKPWDLKIFKQLCRSLFQVCTNTPSREVPKWRNPVLSLSNGKNLVQSPEFLWVFKGWQLFVSSWHFLIESFLNLCPQCFPNWSLSPSSLIGYQFPSYKAHPLPPSSSSPYNITFLRPVWM